MRTVNIRPIAIEDCKLISEAFKEQSWDKPVDQYEYYLELQKQGLRDIILAEVNQQFAGYLTIAWQSNYKPFRQAAIPEVVDFNVLKKFQRQGIGTILMNEAERRIGTKSSFAGIGVGLMQDYGAAQILYIKRG
ncbi:MAG: GNAT family N-acetyltransferase [Bacteroidota bacterium]